MRQRLDLVRAGGIAEHDVGGAAAARLVRQRNEGRGILGVMQFEHGQPDQELGALGIVAAVEQRENGLLQQPRHPHDEFGRRGSRCAASRVSQARSKYSVRISMSASTSMECSSRAGTQTARSGGTSQRPLGVVTCIVPLAA